jgi:hypothetical protein
MFKQVVISVAEMVLGGVILVFVIRAIDRAGKRWHNRSMAASIHILDPQTGFARCGLRAHIQVAAHMSEATCDDCFARMLRDVPEVAEPRLMLPPRKELPPLPGQRKRKRG